MANEIYHANDVQLRQQIKAHLDEADSDISALDTRVTQNESDIDDLEAADVLLDGRLDVLEGFRPSMMQFDGNSYYSGSFTSSGNLITSIIQFNILPFTGDTICRLISITGVSGYTRLSIHGYSSDYSTSARQDKVAFFCEDSSNTTICHLISGDSLMDGQTHTAFFSFNATTGSATLVIDGDDSTFTVAVSPTTGTLESGIGEISIGAYPGGTESVVGNIGFVGHKEAYLTNWGDFFSSSGQPINIDALAWAEFGSQPEYFNPHGQLSNNLGSEADLTSTGTIKLWNPGYDSGEGVTDPSASLLDSRVRRLETGYFPAFMQFNGSSGYYSVTADINTASGWTCVGRFRWDGGTITAAGGFSRNLLYILSASGNVKADVRIINDETADSRAGRLGIFAQNAAGAILLSAVSNIIVSDGEWHSFLASYDPVAGTASIIVDGISGINTGAPGYTLTTGTIATGSGAVTVGARNVPDRYFSGLIGFVGFRGAYLTNYSDFFDDDNNPIEIDELAWGEFGSQPAIWNPHGQVSNNLGTAGAFTKNGVVRLWVDGFGGNMGLVI